jgi:AmiR/NasT family two-component response regulator
MDNLNRVVICFDCVQKLDTPPLDTSDVAAIAAVIISQGERITKLEQQIKELTNANRD